MATAGSERGLSLRSPARYTEAAARLVALYAERRWPSTRAGRPGAPTPWPGPGWTPRPTGSTRCGRPPGCSTAARSAPRPAPTRSTGPRPTWPSTGRPWPCSGTEAELHGDGADGALARRLPLRPGRAHLRRHQRDPAQRGGRAHARAAARLSGGTGRALRLHRPAARVPRRGPPGAGQGVHHRRPPRRLRRPVGPDARGGPRWPSWAWSGLTGPRGPRRARARAGRPGAAARGGRAGGAARAAARDHRPGRPLLAELAVGGARWRGHVGGRGWRPSPRASVGRRRSARRRSPLGAGAPGPTAPTCWSWWRRGDDGGPEIHVVGADRVAVTPVPSLDPTRRLGSARWAGRTRPTPGWPPARRPPSRIRRHRRPGRGRHRRRAARADRPHDHHGRRVRQGAPPVREADRELPGGQAPAGRGPGRPRVRPAGGLRGGVGTGRGRGRRVEDRPLRPRPTPRMRPPRRPGSPSRCTGPSATPGSATCTCSSNGPGPWPRRGARPPTTAHRVLDSLAGADGALGRRLRPARSRPGPSGAAGSGLGEGVDGHPVVRAPTGTGGRAR